MCGKVSRLRGGGIGGCIRRLLGQGLYGNIDCGLDILEKGRVLALEKG